jgi:hypothetical protein
MPRVGRGFQVDAVAGADEMGLEAEGGVGFCAGTEGETRGAAFNRLGPGRTAAK